MRPILALLALFLCAGCQAQTIRQELTATVPSGEDSAVFSPTLLPDREILAILVTIPDINVDSWDVRVRTPADVIVAGWDSVSDNTTAYLEPVDATEVTGERIFTAGEGWDLYILSGAGNQNDEATMTASIVYREPDI